MFEVESEKKEIQQLENEIYQQKLKVESDKKFWEMMNNPEGEQYQMCYDSLNETQQRTEGVGFEKNMRGAFDKNNLF